jgi:dihydrodipicolinate synthase/N-acetylneuraminate lyase
MNAVPRSAQQLMRAVTELGDLALARQIYYEQVLPIVDMLRRNNNPTGTIKAAVGARGVEVGVPRRPGSPVSQLDQATLDQLMADINRAEAGMAAKLQAAGG